MKNISPLACFIIIACTVTAQKQNSPDPWGTWGIGNIKNPNSLNQYENFKIEGFHIYFNWSDLEPQKNTFNWAKLDSQLQIVADGDLWIGLQVMVGPNCPGWIYDNVPEVITTGGNNNGPYPYYLDRDYEVRYFNMMKKVANHLANLPPDLKSHFMYWQISEGSTGDEDPYKGTPTQSQYDIDYYTWEDFRHQSWDSARKYRGNARYRFLFNSGNYAQDLQYVDGNFPGDMHKDGLLSHWYSFDGELLYYARQIRELNEHGYDNRTRGEVQDNFNTSWWKLAPVKQSFTLACSALSCALDMMDIGGGYISSVSGDTRPTDFFKKYAGIRGAEGARKGFIALRDVPDFADIIRFPEDEYGPVIDPAGQATFDKKIQNINNNPQDSSARKYWLKMKAVTQFLNPARVNKIVNEFKPAGAMHNDNGDDYHDDFGINMTKNFLKFIRQINPDATSVGAWRVGPDTSMYGRYAKYFKLEHKQGEMFFRFSEDLVQPNETLQFTVTYYDSGRGIWSINAGNIPEFIKNKDTKQWVQKTIVIENFKERTLLNGEADFSLRYENGGNTAFALIEVEIAGDSRQTGSGNEKITYEDLKLELSPNPNPGRFMVKLTAKANETYSVFVTDAAGNTILSEKRQAINGLNAWSFSSLKFKEGIYVLHIQSAKAKGAVNFIVEK